MADEPNVTITITKATPTDLSSLTTIVPRAFHPVNPYIKRILPDTSHVREWWKQVFSSELEDDNCHIFVARNPNSTDEAETTIGVICIRLMQAGDTSAGLWSLFPPVADMDEALFREMVAGMPEYRAKLMKGKPSYLLELFGVDHAWKGSGIGMRLLAQASEIADTTGYDTFVQANAAAKSFYEKAGFVCQAEVPIGDGKYVECMLVRRCRRGRRQAEVPPI